MSVQRLLLVGFFFLAACNSAKFSANKSTLLSKSSAFGDYNGELHQPGAPGNGIEGGDATGTIRQSEDEEGGAGGLIEQPDGTNDEIDFLLMCSDRRSEDNSNLKHAIANGLPVQLLLDTKICTADAAVIKGLVQKKSFTIADAKQICPALVPASGKWANVSLVIDGNAVSATRGSLTVLYALNDEVEPAAEAADALCDKRSSPLVIHINSDPLNPQPIALSSQANGVSYDLLGARNNHEKVQISWFTNQDYGLLALPDAQGRVSSIDQLFGNATVGPDGRFSENGYEALAKYDGNDDRRIDAKDPVFNELRVWIDRNRDGVSQSKELLGLSRAKVVYIDLEFSNDYAETDIYGNQTLMKSVVGRSDGSLDLIFDLWFAYQFGGF